MRAALLVLGILVAAGEAAGIFEVTVTDATIASFGTAVPSPGAEVVQYSITDKLSFSNGVSLERALWTQTVAASFTDDQDGSVSTTAVGFQGTSATLTDLVYGAQAAAGPFVPFTLVTASDLTGQAGWTKAAACGTVVYQGTFSVPSYTALGVAQSPTTLYYQVCDSNEEIYVGTSTTLTLGDFAYVSSKTTLATTTDADYEVLVLALDYVFSSAASASTVTLRQGHYVPLTSASNDTYLLFRYPDGFPAGTLTATVTTTGADITT